MTAYALPDPPKIRGTNFRLQRVQAFNPLRGGHHQAVDLGESVWICDINTAPLSRAQGGAWKWLIAKLRGMLNTLYLHDVSRPRPLAYIDTDDATGVRIGVTTRRIGLSTRRIAQAEKPWGSPYVISLDREAGTMLVGGYRASAVISDGDYGHWDDGPTRRLHIIGAAVADASGQATLTVEPMPPETSDALPAPFIMEEASAEMVVMQSSAPYSAPVIHEVTLQALQVLQRS